VLLAPTSEAKFGRLVGPEARNDSTHANVDTSSARSSHTGTISLDDSLYHTLCRYPCEHQISYQTQDIIKDIVPDHYRVESHHGVLGHRTHMTLGQVRSTQFNAKNFGGCDQRPGEELPGGLGVPKPTNSGHMTIHDLPKSSHLNTLNPFGCCL